MTIRQTAIAKYDFIDLVICKYQSGVANDKPQDDVAKAWEKWFEGVEHLKVMPTEPASEYHQLLLNKYRKQGLEL